LKVRPHHQPATSNRPPTNDIFFSTINDKLTRLLIHR
jgi:hypothetical protein